MRSYNEEKMLFPNPVGFDDISRLSLIRGYHLLGQIEWPDKTYFHLHGQWNAPYNLPQGYNLYVLSWHMEQVDFDWLKKQEIDAPILVLTDLKSYDSTMWPKNVIPIRWLYWHYALDQMIKLFGVEFHKDIKYKFSAFCNRITQSKMFISTALLENIDRADILIKIGTWIEEKNVHQWQPTGNAVLDNLTNIFQKKYLGHEITMDDFRDNQNYQQFTANPDHIAYQQAALHFTNESFHYSLMHDGDIKYINPGPHLTEKTFKCLLGGTAFIPVGQFDVYRTLGDLGLRFDYGIDLSFDNDPGNLTRLEKTVKLIDRLQKFTASEIYAMTEQSTLHNQAHVASGSFFDLCEKINISTLDSMNKFL